MRWKWDSCEYGIPLEAKPQAHAAPEPPASGGRNSTPAAVAAPEGAVKLPSGFYVFNNKMCPICGKPLLKAQSAVNCQQFHGLVCMDHCYAGCEYFNDSISVAHCNYLYDKGVLSH